MKSGITSGALSFIAVLLCGLSNSDKQAQPIEIDLESPGTAIVIKLNGKHAGGLRVDSQGRLGIYGANYSSTAITIDGRDRVQIDPTPDSNPPTRLTVADDVWLTGMLRVGRADAFGDTPFDPNGAIQVGRKLEKAQIMSMIRVFGQGSERFRLGVSKNGNGFWSNGPHDDPLVTFNVQQPENREAAGIHLHAPLTEFNSNDD